MTVREAIENALAWIEAKNGHRDGDVYQDLEQAQKTLEVLLEHRDVRQVYKDYLALRLQFLGFR